MPPSLRHLKWATVGLVAGSLIRLYTAHDASRTPSHTTSTAPDRTAGGKPFDVNTERTVGRIIATDVNDGTEELVDRLNELDSRTLAEVVSSMIMLKPPPQPHFQYAVECLAAQDPNLLLRKLRPVAAKKEFSQAVYTAFHAFADAREEDGMKQLAALSKPVPAAAEGFLAGLGEKNPKEALRVAAEGKPPFEEKLNWIVQHLLKYDTKTATLAISSLRDSFPGCSWSAALSRSAPLLKKDEMVKVLEGLPPSIEKSEFTKACLFELTSHAPFEAAKLWSELPSNSQDPVSTLQIVKALSMSDVKAAQNMIGSIGDAQVKANAEDVLTAGMLQGGTLSLNDALASAPSRERRAETVRSYLRVLSKKDPQVAWAQLISNRADDQFNAELPGFAEEWASTNPGAAIRSIMAGEADIGTLLDHAFRGFAKGIPNQTRRAREDLLESLKKDASPEKAALLDSAYARYLEAK